MNNDSFELIGIALSSTGSKNPVGNGFYSTDLP